MMGKRAERRKKVIGMGTGMNKVPVLAALFLFAVLAVSAFAAPALADRGLGIAKGKLKEGGDVANAVDKALDPYYLETRAAHLVCRIDFTTAVIDNVVAKVPETSGALSGHSATLKGDKTQLESLAESGDREGFNSFVSGTVKPDMADAIKALAKERRNYKSYNLTNDTIASLHEDYKAANEQMKECEKGSVVKLGQARIRQYNAIIGVWQTTTGKLGEKGVSTAAMQGVIDGAESNVIAPLQSAVDSGDSEQVKAALRTFCLGNGCEGSGDAAPQNYHGFAKINLERLQAIKDKLAESADSSKLDEAQQKFDIARSTLAAVGGNKYTEEQQKAVWDNLKEAGKLIRDYMKENKPKPTATANTVGREAPPAVPAEGSQ